ncbi:MAG: flagellar hook-basal body protein [Lachnospiraceae bacterium]|nr:flagellar hook-basal body protein [Ruminococcus sp.]MCM1273854.1 flagellar hook-basal body protein [Lachnospiraceae bacterium]
MNRGYYYACNGMILNQRRINTIGNNLANASTAGYKRDTLLVDRFDEHMILVKHRQELSGTFAHTYVDSTYTDLEQGFFEQTDSPFDVAIWGDVYFNIAGYNGETMLTRNGDWELDEEGYLTLSNSGRVLGENGEIYIGNKDFVIDVDGRIYQNNERGEREFIDRLALSYIEPGSDVAKFGVNMFTSVNAQPVPEDMRFDIVQGALERSNIDYNYELTMMMNANRLFETNSKILQICDGMNQSAASLCKKV